jgi:hypothetical protein
MGKARLSQLASDIDPPQGFGCPPVDIDVDGLVEKEHHAQAADL